MIPEIYNANFYFVNDDDFKNLCEKNDLSFKDKKSNIIKIENNIYIKFCGDLSDLGNEIGINIAHYIDENKLGYDKSGFITGINHGISLIDKTH